MRLLGRRAQAQRQREMEAAGAASERARPLVCVDLADVETRPREVAAALLSAAENEGFFYLVNHGVPQHEVDAAFALSRGFFAAPDDVKRATRGDTDNAHYVLGYTTEELDEGTMRQGMLCGACAAASTSLHAAPDSRPPRLRGPAAQRTTTRAWRRCGRRRSSCQASNRRVLPPLASTRLRRRTSTAPAECVCGTQRCLHFMRLLDGVVVKLMRCFALALELPEDHFTNAMSPDDDDNGTALFFNRYPSVEGRTFPAGAVRDACAMASRYALL